MSLLFPYQHPISQQAIVPLGGRWVRPRPVVTVALVGPTSTRAIPARSFRISTPVQSAHISRTAMASPSFHHKPAARKQQPCGFGNYTLIDRESVFAPEERKAGFVIADF